MSLKQHTRKQFKHNLLTIFAVISILLLSLTVCKAQVADTSVTIKTTNNELYQLNALFNIAAQNLLKSDMSVKDYIEFQKQYQALLTIWFKQKEEQIKTSNPPKKSN